MNNPAYGLHPLKDDRKRQWAVWVSGNWRLVFAFDGEHVTDPDLIDYSIKPPACRHCTGMNLVNIRVFTRSA